MDERTTQWPLPSFSLNILAGEVVPQAICSRYGLMVGAYSAWFVRLLMILTMPISWPIAKLLDVLLGSEHSVCHVKMSLLLAQVIAFVL